MYSHDASGSFCHFDKGLLGFDVDVNDLFPSVVSYLLVSFDTMSQVLQNVFKQWAEAVNLPRQVLLDF